MTTGRINQVTDRRSLRPGPPPSTAVRTRNAPPRPLKPTVEPPTTVTLSPRDHRVAGLQPSCPTADRTLPATTPPNATHRKGTHASLTAAMTFHSMRAMLAFNVLVNCYPSVSTAINPFLPTFSPSDWKYGTTAAGSGGIRTATETIHPRSSGENLLGEAGWEGRNDRCSSVHDLPGIPAKLRSLPLSRPPSARQGAGNRITVGDLHIL